ncbi:MAG: leucine-rich repeat domain-containing protein [Candidatus Amulumruptor caecigallinarius]|nr:leucine-rich repeat domain-containing protein [Candidatus Amulumruptor caecigallinarius]
MKKIIVATTLLAVAAINTDAWVRNITDGNFEFQIDDEKGTATLLRTIDKSVSSLQIPRVANEGHTRYLVNTLGNEALSGCSGITSLSITNNIILIYTGAFAGCTSLSDVTFEPGVEAYRNAPYWKEFFSSNGVSGVKTDCAGLEEWYTLEGIRLKEKPSGTGIYIIRTPEGSKTVIR